MKITHIAASFCLASSIAFAANPVTDANNNAAYSSSLDPQDSITVTKVGDQTTKTGNSPVDAPAQKPVVMRTSTVRPFGAVGIAIKVGLAGPGVEIATPLSQKWNLRGEFNYIKVSPSFDSDGIHYSGDLKFQSSRIHADFFPWAGSFRISPGVTVYNGNHVNAAALVPGGTKFTLDDQDYQSSAVDPIRGNATLDFGRTVAPNLTVGFGNLIPRKGGHWSVPFEIGAEFVGQPKLTLNLSGTACQVNTVNCFNAATDPQFQSNVRGEEQQINDDLKALQVFPILSIGVGYRF